MKRVLGGCFVPVRHPVMCEVDVQNIQEQIRRIHTIIADMESIILIRR